LKEDEPMRRAPIHASAESVEEAFYDAMRRGDLAAMMDLWSTEDEVVCIHPSGERLVGLDAVRASWEAILTGGTIDVRPASICVHASAVVAVHNLIERITVSGQMGRQVLECLATNAYSKTSLGWRMVLHHGSPATEGDSSAASAAPAGSVLH
jgi:ketosteroid isomerase-like protein